MVGVEQEVLNRIGEKEDGDSPGRKFFRLIGQPSKIAASIH
jgi:hypothetical protein